MTLPLVIGACSDGGDDRLLSSRRAAPSTEASTTTVPATVAPAPSTAARATAAKATASKATAASERPARAGPARASGPTASALDSPSARFTAPGRYTYASSGMFSSLLSGPQPRSGGVVLVVDPPQGHEQRSVRQASDLTTEQVLRFEGDGTYLVSMSQTFLGVRKDFRFEPPVLALPTPAEAGRSWSWRATSTDGRTTVDAGLRVSRAETVDVGGVPVPTVVVEARVSTGGDVVASSTQELWVSERHRLIVRLHEVTDGRLGAISFRSESTDHLTSLAPG